MSLMLACSRASSIVDAEQVGDLLDAAVTSHISSAASTAGPACGMIVAACASHRATTP
ncbi:MAG: hypothetical protein MUE97_01840 [Phycisphaerales bacterium]|jgi:exosome complex RNA-binding protein Csl4|nr:hypothetical protein [Phycisphaerales bacterium]